MRRLWLFGVAGIFGALWLMVACSIPTLNNNHADQTTSPLAQPDPLTITITTDLQAAALTNPLVLTQTEPLVWLALAEKDHESPNLSQAEIGIESRIYPAPLISVNGLGQQTTITTATYGLIYREQGLPLPIFYVPNPTPNQPFSAHVFADRVEISARATVLFSPKLDYIAGWIKTIGESSDTHRLELTNVQTGVTKSIVEEATDLRQYGRLIGWSEGGIYGISWMYGSQPYTKIRRYDPNKANSTIQEWYVGGDGGFDDYFIDIQHDLLAFAQNEWEPKAGDPTISIDNLSISPDGRYLAYLYHPTLTEYAKPTPANIRVYSIEQQHALGELAMGVNPDISRRYYATNSLPFDPTMLLWSADSHYLLALTCDQHIPWHRTYGLETIVPTCDDTSPVEQQRHGLVFRIADQRQVADIVLPAHTSSIKLIRPNLLAMIAYVKGEALLIFCDLETGQQTIPLALGKVVPLIVYPR
ncbi:hypothetical protein [Herpetosiphon llansteffanensis]|uniref:hypothetical protein n=1 Tax=Herpetosiphon llansteffanensis TaxID=2094568 RepID=UPI000D7C48DB|nr:hypothetical protein [Herpetosiphon llansteffanensis]